jgi:hypothetical protein
MQQVEQSAAHLKMMKIGPTLETKHEEVRKTRGREETGVGRRTKTEQKQNCT